jgi:hypothetical protein
MGWWRSSCSGKVVAVGTRADLRYKTVRLQYPSVDPTNSIPFH